MPLLFLSPHSHTLSPSLIPTSQPPPASCVFCFSFLFLFSCFLFYFLVLGFWVSIGGVRKGILLNFDWLVEIRVKRRDPPKWHGGKIVGGKRKMRIGGGRDWVLGGFWRMSGGEGPHFRCCRTRFPFYSWPGPPIPLNCVLPSLPLLLFFFSFLLIFSKEKGKL